MGAVRGEGRAGERYPGGLSLEYVLAAQRFEIQYQLKLPLFTACKEVIYGVGGCLYPDILVGEVGEIFQCVQKEAGATFS